MRGFWLRNWPLLLLATAFLGLVALMWWDLI
jgi:hypothetical protein